MVSASRAVTANSVGVTAAPDDAPALVVDGLTKSFGAQTVVDAISLDIARGEVHALLGENGSGKSTLIKMLSGYHRPDSGTVTVAGRRLAMGDPAEAYRLGCHTVHQDLGLIPSLSIADNLSLTGGFTTRFKTIRSGREIRRAKQDLDALGIDVDPRVRVEDLPVALRTSVAVARALRAVADWPVRLLVMDEPTAASPADEVERLLDVVRAVAATGVGVLYVTHRLEEVFQIANRVTVIRDGRKVCTEPTSELSRQKIIALLTGNDLFEDTAAESSDPPPTQREPALEVRSLTGEELADVSISVSPGEILGVAGITGSGRERLLGSIFGATPSEAREMRVRGEPLAQSRPDRSIARGMVYLPPDRKSQGGFMDLTARENMMVADLAPFWHRMKLWRRPETAETRRWFEELSIRPIGGGDRPLGTFSGGNQQKVLLAKLLRLDPSVLLLDEPTQGVDIPSKAVIYEHVLEVSRSGCAVLVSSADVDELVALSHRVIVLREGRIVAELSGSAVTPSAIAFHSLGGQVVAA